MFPTNREIWKTISEYAEYEVSNFGRVRNATTDRILKGAINAGGYWVVGLSKKGKAKTHYKHQLVAREWLTNPNEKRCVDHIDGDKTNNHQEILRYATHTENGRNAKKTNKASSSIYKGVNLIKVSMQWCAYIRINGKIKHLGCFTDERAAAEAYNTAALEHFKEYAKLNDLD